MSACAEWLATEVASACAQIERRDCGGMTLLEPFGSTVCVSVTVEYRWRDPYSTLWHESQWDECTGSMGPLASATLYTIRYDTIGIRVRTYKQGGSA